MADISGPVGPFRLKLGQKRQPSLLQLIASSCSVQSLRRPARPAERHFPRSIFPLCTTRNRKKNTGTKNGDRRFGPSGARAEDVSVDGRLGGGKPTENSIADGGTAFVYKKDLHGRKQIAEK